MHGWYTFSNLSLMGLGFISVMRSAIAWPVTHACSRDMPGSSTKTLKHARGGGGGGGGGGTGHQGPLSMSPPWTRALTVQDRAGVFLQSQVPVRISIHDASRKLALDGAHGLHVHRGARHAARGRSRYA